MMSHATTTWVWPSKTQTKEISHSGIDVCNIPALLMATKPPFLG